MSIRKTLRLAVLIPALNEAERIQDTVVASALISEVAGVLVVDDGSRDDTVERALRSGALVIENKGRHGKGEAMELAAQTLEQMQPFGELDGVLLLDGDLGASASEASHLIEPLAQDTADLVIGVLPSPTGKAGFGWARSLARDGIAEYGDGFIAKAPLSGQRALTIDCLKRVRPFSSAYSMEVAMTISALRQKLRVCEVPVAMEHRLTGRNLKGFLHRGRQFYQIYQFLSSFRAKQTL